MERIEKEAVLAYAGYYLGICGGLKKTTETFSLVSRCSVLPFLKFAGIENSFSSSSVLK
jgi:hypothetical protein